VCVRLSACVCVCVCVRVCACVSVHLTTCMISNSSSNMASFALLLHCSYTSVTLLLHCCHTVVTLLSHCYYTVDHMHDLEQQLEDSLFRPGRALFVGE
jgi:hypothetical protein